MQPLANMLHYGAWTSAKDLDTARSFIEFLLLACRGGSEAGCSAQAMASTGVGRMDIMTDIAFSQSEQMRHGRIFLP